jgi:phage terminase small subunit
VTTDVPDQPDDPTEDADNVNLPADVQASIAQRYRNFARQMACCENATKAARAAGWTADPKKQGWRLMKRPAVLAMVEEERKARADRLRLDDQRILDAYTLIAFHDPRSIVRWDETGEATVRSSDDLTEDEAMLVQSVERHETVDKETGAVTSVKTRVKLASRENALAQLAKIRGLVRDKLDIEVTVGVADEMAAIRARRIARIGQQRGPVIDVEPVAAPPAPVAMPVPSAGPGRAARFLQRMGDSDE